MVLFFFVVGMLIGALFGSVGFFIGGALGLWLGFSAADEYEKQQNNEQAGSSKSEPSSASTAAEEKPFRSDSKSNLYSSTTYSAVIPQLIAACVSADGEMSEAEVDLAIQFVENDEYILDKASALASLHTHHEIFSKARQTGRSIYKLKITTVIHKALEIQDPLERARVLVILNAMLEVAGNEPPDEIRHLIAEIKQGWRDAPKPISKMQAAEEFVLKSGDREAIDAFRKMKQDPSRYGQGFKRAAQGNSVLRIALGVFTGMVAAELVTGAIYQHQLQEALAQFDMELASMGGIENLSFDAAPLATPAFQTASWQEPVDDISSDMECDDSMIEESGTDGLEDAELDTDFDFFV